MPLQDNLINDADSFKRFLQFDQNLHHAPVNGGYINFLKDIYPDNYYMQTKTITDFYDLERDGINRPVLMEFFTAQGDVDALETLLNKEKELGHVDVWWSLFHLQLKRRKFQIKGNELINAVYVLKNDSNESLVLSLILHLYGILQLCLYEPLDKIRRAVEPLADSIENDYLRYSYKIRLKEIEAISKLCLNDKLGCRKLCLSVISMKHLENLYPITFANFFQILGQTYMFEDFDKAEYWIIQGKDLIQKSPNKTANHRKSEIENTYDFLRSLWKCKINESFPVDKAELAHRYLVLGDYEKTISILDELKASNGQLTSYQLYYYALATDNEELLDVAGEKFKEDSNFFYYQLLHPDILNRYRNKEKVGGK